MGMSMCWRAGVRGFVAGGELVEVFMKKNGLLMQFESDLTAQEEGILERNFRDVNRACKRWLEARGLHASMRDVIQISADAAAKKRRVSREMRAIRRDLAVEPDACVRTGGEMDGRDVEARLPEFGGDRGL